MKLKGAILPGYAVYEYFLIISLPPVIQTEILALRRDFHHKYETTHHIKGRPSLALALFLQYEGMEDKVLSSFQRTASNFDPITINLDNFVCFGTHSISVSVGANPNISGSNIYEVAKSIRDQARGLLQVNKETKPMLMLQPHIGIVRKLQHDVFDEAWKYYRGKQYQNSFISHEMILLRRPTHDSNWQVVEHFQFENKSTPAQQGKLF